MVKCFTPEDFQETKIIRVKFNDIKDKLTEEQIKAIEQCHNAYFIANMSDDYNRCEEEKTEALKNLQKHFNNLIRFVGDFYNGNDTLIFESEVK